VTIRESILVGAEATQPKSITIWSVIRRYLSEQGLPMEYALFSTYDALNRALLNEEIDIAWNAPMAHAQVLIQGNGACRTLAMRDTDEDVVTVLVARTDSGIDSLDQLRGKKVALGLDISSELRLIPVHQLRKEGLDLETDCEVVCVEPREYPGGKRWIDDAAIAEAVLGGVADAGALWEPALKRLEREGRLKTDDLTVVWRGEPYCHCAFTARPGLPEGVGQQFIEAMTSMEASDESLREMMELEGLSRWIPADDSGWADLIAAIEETGLVGRTF